MHVYLLYEIIIIITREQLQYHLKYKHFENYLQFTYVLYIHVATNQKNRLSSAVGVLKHVLLCSSWCTCRWKVKGEVVELHPR